MANIKETFNDQLTLAQQIEEQQQIEGATDEPVKPIRTPMVAKSHTLVYTMHRFFARRPHNVFEALIKHYTKPGDIILDPFMGGGVTVIESLRTRRRVIGIDLNPLAHFIVDNEVSTVNLREVRQQFTKLEKEMKPKIYKLYEVSCDNCGGMAITRWAKWSLIVNCPLPLCGRTVIISEAAKVSGGRYQCPFCKGVFPTVECERLGETMVRIKYDCPQCNTSSERVPTQDDKDRYQAVVNQLNKSLKTGSLRYPDDAIPDGDRVRDDALFRKGYTHFHQLFTVRNLLANSMLKRTIMKMKPEIRRSLLFIFSSSLSWSCKMRKDIGHGWEHHGYWLPDIHFESNVWDMLKKQFDSGSHCFWKGKEYANKEFGSFAKPAKNYQDIKEQEGTYLLLCQSSHKLPLPDSSINIVITDPPFGGNVQYAELSDFWVVWLKETLGLDGIVDNTFEAIQTRNTGFPTEKSLEHYEDMLFQIFRECHRVLKPYGWMVLTFHNRNLEVWMALHRAANRAGFKLPPEEQDVRRGMLYQPPIQHYTTTMHQRAAGAMLGDFILSFYRQDTIPSEIISGSLSTYDEHELLHHCEKLIQYHGGADDSTLMTGLVPYLAEKNLFHKLASKDFKSFLSEHFIRNKQEKKWFTKDMIDMQTDSIKPIDYIPAEQFTEDVVYSLLKERQYVSLDDILSTVYEQLVNSYRPGIPAINKVLNKICDQVPLPGQSHRQGFRLKQKSAKDITITPPKTEKQMTLFGTWKMVTALNHNEIIELLCGYAFEEGYDVHIGETEQKKVPKFKNKSTQMISHIAFGLPPEVFKTVLEIDVLFLKGATITHAFEVVTSVETANKAVNDRYRNLFKETPNITIKACLVVRDKDIRKARKIVYSKANMKDGISKRIQVIPLSDLTKERFQQLL